MRTAILILAAATALIAGEKAPLPDKLVSARSVYIQNDSGDPKFADAMYSTLKEWGQWEVVTDRSKADLIAVLDHKDIFIHNDWTLTLIDPNTSEKIWSERHDAAINARRIISRELTSDLRKRLPSGK